MLERKGAQRANAHYGEVHHPHTRIESTNQGRKHRTKEETLLGKLQPEAAYFCPIDGKRGGFLVINFEEESEVVTKLEPLWLELDATVETFPVMTADDLRAGLQRL